MQTTLSSGLIVVSRHPFDPQALAVGVVTSELRALDDAAVRQIVAREIAARGPGFAAGTVHEGVHAFRNARGALPADTVQLADPATGKPLYVADYARVPLSGMAVLTYTDAASKETHVLMGKRQQELEGFAILPGGYVKQPYAPRPGEEHLPPAEANDRDIARNRLAEEIALEGIRVGDIPCKAVGPMYFEYLEMSGARFQQGQQYVWFDLGERDEAPGVTALKRGHIFDFTWVNTSRLEALPEGHDLYANRASRNFYDPEHGFKVAEEHARGIEAALLELRQGHLAARQDEPAFRILGRGR